jgi:LacI family transcriptional regulator
MKSSVINFDASAVSFASHSAHESWGAASRYSAFNAIICMRISLSRIDGIHMVAKSSGRKRSIRKDASSVPKGALAPKPDGADAKYAKKSTVKDVARAANVSIATVSYVLNNTGSVGNVVRQRVLQIARRLGYRRNQSAHAMRTGRTNAIGLVLPDLCNPFFPELAQSVERAAQLAGYAVLLVDSHDLRGEREGLERLQEHGSDGIVWCPATSEDTAANVGMGVPVVVIDRPIPGYDTVSANYVQGGFLLAEHLAHNRFHRVGLITGPQEIHIAKVRRDCLVQSLPRSVKVVWEVENPFSTVLTNPVMASVRRKPMVSAIVCGNDLIAVGVIRLLTDHGIAIPGDVAVLGFDDIPWASLVNPPLTTVRQPLAVIGAKAVHLLLQRMSNPDMPPRSIEVGVSLIRRRSSEIS